MSKRVPGSIVRGERGKGEFDQLMEHHLRGESSGDCVLRFRTSGPNYSNNLSRLAAVMHIFSVTSQQIGTQSLKPYHGFRYTLLVPTVARVHFLNLKPFVCMLISTVSTWDIGTKYWYEIPQGFEYQSKTIRGNKNVS
jgi:hypothetical protein